MASILEECCYLCPDKDGQLRLLQWPSTAAPHLVPHSLKVKRAPTFVAYFCQSMDGDRSAGGVCVCVCLSEFFSLSLSLSLPFDTTQEAVKWAIRWYSPKWLSVLSVLFAELEAATSRLNKPHHQQQIGPLLCAELESFLQRAVDHAQHVVK